MAGYSGTPLIKKLGIKPGFSIGLINPPDDYLTLLGKLPPDVNFRRRLVAPTDFVHVFAASQRDLDKSLPRAMRALGSCSMLWLSWPKQSSGIATDLNGNSVRKSGLAAGLVDIKVCAVDDTWSALKFVYRVKNR